MVITLPLFYKPDREGIGSLFAQLSRLEMIRDSAGGQIVKLERDGETIRLVNLNAKVQPIQFTVSFFPDGKAKVANELFQAIMPELGNTNWANAIIWVISALFNPIGSSVPVAMRANNDFVTIEVLDC